MTITTTAVKDTVTKQDLIEVAKSKGYEIDECANYNEALDTYTYLIGVRHPKQSVWHWFEIQENDKLYFDHSYSCNTGKTMKSLGHRMRVKGSLGFYASIDTMFKARNAAFKRDLKAATTMEEIKKVYDKYKAIVTLEAPTQ